MTGGLGVPDLSVGAYVLTQSREQGSATRTHHAGHRRLPPAAGRPGWFNRKEAASQAVPMEVPDHGILLEHALAHERNAYGTRMPGYTFPPRNPASPATPQKYWQ